MKKRVVAIISAFSLVLSLFSGMLLQLEAESAIPYARELADYPSARTFYVAEQADLEALAAAVNGGNNMKGYTFLQTADIALEGAWTPIGQNYDNAGYGKGTTATPFRGTYDGQKYTVSNLQIDLDKNGVGLFGCCYMATLKNIGIESGSVKGVNRAGGVAGYADSCTIINCYNKANITLKSGADGVGGIAGVARPIYGNAKVYGCFNLGTLTAVTAGASGIIGWSGNGDIIDLYGCYNGGTIEATGNTSSSELSFDPICRNPNRVTGDFSDSYYLTGSCDDVYNTHNATVLQSENNALMAYIMNHATGSNSNAFCLDENGSLVFYRGSGTATTEVTVTVTRGGVTLGSEVIYLAEGQNYTIPETYNGFSVNSAYTGGYRYFEGEEISSAEGILSVEVVLDGTYPAVTSIASEPDSDIYTVSTAAELAEMATLVNAGYDFAGKRVAVIADLDFSAYSTWKPIGVITESPSGNPDANAKAFKGTFDGQNHHFKNINFSQTGHYQSLFLYIEGGLIQNIILDEGTITSTGIRAAALVSMLRNSTMKNVENHLSVYSTSSNICRNMGVVALAPDSYISDVVSYGTMGYDNGEEQQNGGIVGYGYENHGGHTCTVENCIVAGPVNGLESDPIGRKIKTPVNCYFVGTSMEEETMSSGKAAWLLNTNSSAVWATGKSGPTLDPAKATYQVTYIATDSKGNRLDPIYAYHNAGAAVVLPEIAGYTVASAIYKGITMETGFTMPAANVMATLTLKNGVYDLCFELNGGSFVVEPETSYTAGYGIDLPGPDTLVRAGYSFAGWYLTADYSGAKQTAITGKEGKDLIFYAKWVVPTEISTAAQLTALATGDLNGCYILTADIDLTGVNYTSIGTLAAPFTGNFDGNGHTISGLTLETDEDYQGLFGVNAGLIRNVTLAKDCLIRGNAYVGGIAGKNTGAIIDCISRATVSSKVKEGGTYKIMSQNLCLWGDNEFKGTTKSRRYGMLNRIKTYDPDLIAFQEVSTTTNSSGVQAWSTWLENNLTKYTVYTQDRGDNEGVAVAYKTDKFTELEYGYFWISETPEVQSKSWNAEYLRVCNYVVLQSKATGEQLVLYSIHLDNKSATAREEGAKLVVSRIEEMMKKYPTALFFAAGDYNETETKAGYKAFTASMDDTRYIADVTTDMNTHYTAYNDLSATPDGRIDFIMTTGDTVEVSEFQVLDQTYDATTGALSSGEGAVRPSDHNSLMATFTGVSDMRLGGITGANTGTVRQTIVQGSVSGDKEIGLAIGVNEGTAEEIYAEQAAISASSASEVAALGADPVEMAYAINQKAGYTAFTVKNGAYAVAAQAESKPVRLTINGTGVYALSGTTLELDTTGIENPVCALNNIYFEGTTLTVPETDGVVTVTEDVECTEHDYSIYISVSSNKHYKVCSANPKHNTSSTPEWHTLTSEQVSGQCAEQGYTRYTCTLCGYYCDDDHTDAPGHSWGAWTEDYPATETTQGRLSRGCVNCTAVETRVIPCSTDLAVVATADASESGYLTVRVDIQNNPGLAALAVRLDYDPSLLEPLEDEDGYVFEKGSALSGYTALGFYENYVDLSYFSGSNDAESGNFFTLHFKIIGTGKTTLGVTVEQASETHEVNGEWPITAVTVYEKDDTVYVHPAHTYTYDSTAQQYICSCGEVKLYGTDVNSDGSLSTLDATVMMQYMTGNQDLDIDLIAADFNGDGTVSVMDGVILLRRLNA